VQTFIVTGMTCEHCVRAVGGAIRGLDPAAHVEVDLQSGRVSVRGGRASAGAIVQAIEAEGYRATPSVA